MTKEEVIKELRYLYTCGVSCIKRPQTEALAMAIATLQEEPVSKDLERAALLHYPKMSRISESHCVIPADNQSHYLGDANEDKRKAFIVGAQWQEKQDQETIELAEDHAYFAGRTKTVDEIKETLLSEVLPYFMHGGEADEVVAKLDEVLNRKK